MERISNILDVNIEYSSDSPQYSINIQNDSNNLPNKISIPISSKIDIYFDVEKHFTKGFVKISYQMFKNYTLSFVLSLTLMILTIPYLIYIHKKQLEELEEKKEIERNSAIAQTTQMLAHDVRKPFTMIKGLISTIEAIQDPEKIKIIASSFLPEVNYAISSVNGMIQDIMDIGSNEVNLFPEPSNIQSIIISALNEIFCFNQNTNITLKYDLKHKHKILADSLKIARVFSNIIGNASQAMKDSGNIWIRTTELKLSDFSMIEICIGNR